MTMAWSCDEKNRDACRNAHGCHCREIAALMVQRDNLDRALRLKDRAMGVLIERMPNSVDISDLVS